MGERVVAMNEVNLEMWHDEQVRDFLWTTLRDACQSIAADHGHTLADDPGERTIVYLQDIGTEDEPFEITCLEDEAEFVRLRLICVTVPR